MVSYASSVFSIPAGESAPDFSMPAASCVITDAVSPSLEASRIEFEPMSIAARFILFSELIVEKEKTDFAVGLFFV